MIWIALVFCIVGAVGSLVLLTVDFGNCWDLAESLKRIKNKTRRLT
ncbi:MAG: hypothetical protein HWN68_15935 [Desulfobacterales bacterium]|nr:hypothetical protein [Desulfobacterales bacterium]